MWHFDLSHFYLAHHGIKGQKWGVRHGPPYPLDRQKKNKTKLHEYDIIDYSTGDIFHFAERSKLQNKQVFAGKGSSTKLRKEVADGLSEQIGGKPENWQHCKADGVIDFYGEERKAEVHWFQEESVGKHKFKVKKWLD